MKMMTLALLAAAGLLVAACDSDAPAPGAGNPAPEHVDNECPRADGEPCK